MFYLTLLSILDIREKKVPVWLLLAGIGSAAVLKIVGELGNGRGWTSVLAELILGMMPGAFLLLVSFLSGKAGYGDGLVLLALGILYGYLPTFILLSGSLLLLSAISIILLLGKRVKRDTKIPYLPFLSAVYIGYYFWVQ